MILFVMCVRWGCYTLIKISSFDAFCLWKEPLCTYVVWNHVMWSNYVVHHNAKFPLKNVTFWLGSTLTHEYGNHWKQHSLNRPIDKLTSFGLLRVAFSRKGCQRLWKKTEEKKKRETEGKFRTAHRKEHKSITKPIVYLSTSSASRDSTFLFWFQFFIWARTWKLGKRLGKRLVSIEKGWQAMKYQGKGHKKASGKALWCI